MTAQIEPDPRRMENGRVLLLQVRYLPEEGFKPNETVYTYVAIKSAGHWYLSGGARCPQAAGWGAVERWLERDNRELVSVDLVTETRTIWPVDTSPCFCGDDASCSACNQVDTLQA